MALRAATRRCHADVEGTLCDGRPGITFAAFSMAGGLSDPETVVTGENGHLYVIVEGTCRFWSKTGRYSRVSTGVLNAEQRRALREAFQLDRFQELVGDYLRSGAADGPSVFYVFGRGGLEAPCEPWGEALTFL